MKADKKYFIKMPMKKTFTNFLFLFSITAVLLCACSNNAESNTGYDGREFDISINQDKSLLLTSNKNNGRYSLTITGSGNAVDYSRKEEAPWYPLVKFVDQVSINEGITHIGNYFFSALNLDYYVLPSTVRSVGEHAFNDKAIIYTYGDELTNICNDVYLYSETAPTVAGNYFYMKEGVPTIWETSFSPKSFLFIGNSFTYMTGTVEDPMVPKYFANIAKNLGHDVAVDYVVEGSYKLASYADPNDAKGAIVEQKLTTNKYDVVILQEQSTTPINNYTNFENAVKKLKARIDKTQNNCRTYLYETWDTPYNCNDKPETYGTTVGEMEAKIRTAYTNCGETTGCYVNYIGKAFTYAYETLNINVFYTDNRHQGANGSYLSAACHVKSIFKGQVSGCTEYCSLDQNECKTLLGVADTIC